MFARIARFLKPRRYRPYSCPYVGGSTRYATGERGDGACPPTPSYELRGVGMGSLGVSRREGGK
ncbi:hypothetical protein [Streptomyces sp. NBC_00989]|uniref:hypothetical protein n=1 Tax=Streptomyces sp. NBC_00989 TaxID=2903705 RepID=UPI0038705638|nr:hypothetical protein OG714_32235 [Streptomyces sp. NBC_00989]